MPLISLLQENKSFPKSIFHVLLYSFVFHLTPQKINPKAENSNLSHSSRWCLLFQVCAQPEHLVRFHLQPADHVPSLSCHRAPCLVILQVVLAPCAAHMVWASGQGLAVLFQEQPLCVFPLRKSGGSSSRARSLSIHVPPHLGGQPGDPRLDREKGKLGCV